MMNLMRLMKKRKSGFTLVELMVVVVIIGILVAIAIPIYGGIQRRAAQRAHDANIRTLKGAASIMITEHGYPDATWTSGTAGTTTYVTIPGDPAIDVTLLDYLTEWPDVPPLWEHYAAGDLYNVQIGIDGSIDVIPDEDGEKAF